MIAEIEYASQAQRGDFWGKGGYPYTFHADGLADPTKEYDVAVIDVAYRGDAEDVQYSPKQLYVVGEKTTTTSNGTTTVTMPITGSNGVMDAITSYLH